MTMTPRSAAAASLLVLLASSCAGASSEPQPTRPAGPASDPALTNPSVEDRLLELDRDAGTPPPLQPERPAAAHPARPGLLGDLLTPSGPLIREGTFLVSRRGRLVEQPEGWTLYFDPDAEGQADSPMIVMPGTTLAGMRRLVESRPERTTFLVSGEVFVYRGRNYLRPTVYTLASGASEPAQQPVEPPPAPDDQESETSGDDPSAEDILRSMERPRASRAAAGAAAAAAGAGSDAVAAHREGEFLSSRRARLVRDGAGRWLLTFDTGDAATGEPPIRVLPCRMLERMETLAQRAGDGLAMTVSGRLFVYEGENHLLPSLFLVDYAAAQADIRSAQ